MKTIIIAKDKEHLESLVEEEMTLYGIKAQMNTLSNPQYYDNGCTNISRRKLCYKC